MNHTPSKRAVLRLVKRPRHTSIQNTLRFFSSTKFTRESPKQQSGANDASDAESTSFIEKWKTKFLSKCPVPEPMLKYLRKYYSQQQPTQNENSNNDENQQQQETKKDLLSQIFTPKMNAFIALVVLVNLSFWVMKKNRDAEKEQAEFEEHQRLNPTPVKRPVKNQEAEAQLTPSVRLERGARWLQTYYSHPDKEQLFTYLKYVICNPEYLKPWAEPLKNNLDFALDGLLASILVQDEAFTKEVFLKLVKPAHVTKISLLEKRRIEMALSLLLAAPDFFNSVEAKNPISLSKLQSYIASTDKQTEQEKKEFNEMLKRIESQASVLRSDIENNKIYALHLKKGLFYGTGNSETVKTILNDYLQLYNETKKPQTSTKKTTGTKVTSTLVESDLHNTILNILTDYSKNSLDPLKDFFEANKESMKKNQPEIYAIFQQLLGRFGHTSSRKLLERPSAQQLDNDDIEPTEPEINSSFYWLMTYFNTSAGPQSLEIIDRNLKVITKSQLVEVKYFNNMLLGFVYQLAKSNPTFLSEYLEPKAAQINSSTTHKPSSYRQLMTASSSMVSDAEAHLANAHDIDLIYFNLGSFFASGDQKRVLDALALVEKQYQENEEKLENEKKISLVRLGSSIHSKYRSTLNQMVPNIIAYVSATPQGLEALKQYYEQREAQNHHTILSSYIKEFLSAKQKL